MSCPVYGFCNDALFLTEEGLKAFLIANSEEWVRGDSFGIRCREGEAMTRETLRFNLDEIHELPEIFADMIEHSIDWNTPLTEISWHTAVYVGA